MDINSKPTPQLLLQWAIVSFFSDDRNNIEHMWSFSCLHRQTESVHNSTHIISFGSNPFLPISSVFSTPKSSIPSNNWNKFCICSGVSSFQRFFTFFRRKIVGAIKKNEDCSHKSVMKLARCVPNSQFSSLFPNLQLCLSQSEYAETNLQFLPMVYFADICD